MTEPDHRPATCHDVRDDYDDEFSRSWSPREVARRRVFPLAVAFVVLGIIGLSGMVTLVSVIVVAFATDTDFSDELVPYFFLAVLGSALFALVIAGGLCLIRVQRYWLALAAAYCLAWLAVVGVYAILFFPFGIWGLILLYRPDVREEFRRSARVDD